MSGPGAARRIATSPFGGGVVAVYILRTVRDCLRALSVNERSAARGRGVSDGLTRDWVPSWTTVGRVTAPFVDTLLFDYSRRSFGSYHRWRAVAPVSFSTGTMLVQADGVSTLIHVLSLYTKRRDSPVSGLREVPLHRCLSWLPAGLRRRHRRPSPSCSSASRSSGSMATIPSPFTSTSSLSSMCCSAMAISSSSRRASSATTAVPCWLSTSQSVVEAQAGVRTDAQGSGLTSSNKTWRWRSVRYVGLQSDAGARLFAVQSCLRHSPPCHRRGWGAPSQASTPTSWRATSDGASL